jgi:hypothetical protein
MSQSLITEREIQLVWLLGLFRRHGLLTEEGRRIDVRFPGFPAGEGGPDFREARLVVDGESRVGDVEVHLEPSGWRRHGHETDPAYGGVILHVAWRRDAFDRATSGRGGIIPVLILEPYLELPAAELMARLVPAPVRHASPVEMEGLGEERVAARVRALQRSARRLGPDGALYRELMVGLGYRHNKPGFAELARIVPWGRVRGVDPGEARRAYERPFASIPWRRCGRPANHPARRLEGWSRFIGSVGDELIETFTGQPQGAEARLDPDGAGLIGPERAHDLVVNAVLPALIAFGSPTVRRAARERLRAPEAAHPNRRVREAAAALGIDVPRSALARLGLLEWESRASQ